MDIEEEGNNMKTSNSKLPFQLRYKKLELKGEGSYGKVYRSKDTELGIIVAIKKILLQNFGTDEGMPYTSLREISILKSLNHQNIVRLLHVDYQPENQKLSLVFEYVESDLKRHIVDNLRIERMGEIKEILKQILIGMDFMFSKGFLHRDLKPHNILVTTSNIVKLADFGLSRHFNFPNNDHSKEIQTLWYRSPEIMLGDKDYCISLDMWSLGCIFAEMLDKKVIFKGDSQIDMIFKIFQTIGTPNEETYPGVTKLPDWLLSFPKFPPKRLNSLYPELKGHALDLISMMLVINPQNRITAKDALKHPFFTN